MGSCHPLGFSARPLCFACYGNPEITSVMSRSQAKTMYIMKEYELPNVVSILIIFVCVCVCKCVCMYAYIYSCVCVHVCYINLCVYLFVSVCLRMCPCVCVHIYLCVFVRVGIYATSCMRTLVLSSSINLNVHLLLSLSVGLFVTFVCLF